MFCKNCGQQIPDNLSFCSFCGTPVKQAPQMQNDKTQVLSNMPPQAFQQETQIFTPMQQMPVQQAPVQEMPPQPAPAPKKKKSPQKSSNNGVVIALIVLLIVVVIGGVILGVVFLTNDDDSNKKEEKTTETTISTTVTTQSTTAPDNTPVQPADTYIQATSSDFRLLENIFSSACMYTDNYHPKNVTAQQDVGLILLDLFAETYYICADEYGWDYPESYYPYYEGDKPDPRGVFSTEAYEGYFVFPEDKIQWISKNMFNLTLTDSEGYVPNEDYEGNIVDELVWYYDNGKYYSSIIATGMEGYYFAEIDSSNLRDDGKYEFSMNLYYAEMDYPSEYICNYEVVAGLKEVDGTRIWSFDEWNITD